LLKIDVEGIQDTVHELRKFEPELYKQFQKDLKNEPGVQEVITAIKSRVPVVSPLSGMEHSGRTRFEKPKVRVSLRPSVRLNFSNQRSLLKIEAVSPSNAVGFEILDIVGRGPNSGTAKARGMLSKLTVPASRYVWRGFEERREAINKAVVSVIDRYAKMVNVKLRIK
jgi:hypothetical protein